MKRYLVGAEVGASKISAGVYEEGGRRLCVIRRSTKQERGADVVAARLVRCIEDVVDEIDRQMTHVRGIGIGVPGTVSDGLDSRVDSERLSWEGFPLAAKVSGALGVPTFVENHHVLSTVGVYSSEVRTGEGRVLVVILGARIGAGMILDGVLDRSFDPAGSAIAHGILVADGPLCRCGRRGCFEALASRTSVVQSIRAGVERGQLSLVSEAVLSRGALSDKELRRAFRAGDPLVLEAMRAMAYWTGRAVAQVIVAHRPEVVILGGGIMESLGEELMPRVVGAVLEAGGDRLLEGVRLMFSALGDEACLVGAVEYARCMTQPGIDALRARGFVLGHGA